MYVVTVADSSRGLVTMDIFVREYPPGLTRTEIVAKKFAGTQETAIRFDLVSEVGIVDMSDTVVYLCDDLPKIFRTIAVEWANE